MRFGLLFSVFLMTSISWGANISHTFDRLDNQPLTLTLSGGVERGDAELIKKSLLELKGKEFVFNLNSPGGYVVEGKAIIEQMQELQRQGVKIITSVKNGDQCGSICLPIYLAGDQRRAGSHATFYFHGVTHLFCNVPNERLTEEYISLLLELGAKKEFIDFLRAEEAFTTPGEYWMTGKELYDQGQGFITEITGRHRKLRPQCPNRFPERPR